MPAQRTRRTNSFEVERSEKTAMRHYLGIDVLRIKHRQNRFCGLLSGREQTLASQNTKN